jgi:hypothetical protein
MQWEVHTKIYCILQRKNTEHQEARRVICPRFEPRNSSLQPPYLELHNCHSQLRYFNRFQSNFSAKRVLPSSYLFWAVKRLVDYCNYPTVLKEKTWRNRMSTTCAICWLKSVLYEEKRRTGSDSGQTNATKTVSNVFRHRSETGKLYCRTRSDVGSERVKLVSHSCAW